MKKRWLSVVLLCTLSMVVVGMTQTPHNRSRSASGSTSALWSLLFSTPAEETNGPLVTEAIGPVFTPALRDLPEAQFEAQLEREINPRMSPLSLLGWTGTAEDDDTPDSLIGKTNKTRTPDPIATYEGGDNLCACSPPDTVGDVGPNHYVQMVNATIINIYDKNGTNIVANRDLSDLWTSGTCSTTSDGDPIVLYDELADRWFLAQFYANGICAAVSQTPDPTGSYFGYQFPTPTFPDYFKFGVWPDAYYMSANEYQIDEYTVFAFDRTKMLTGQAATSQRFLGPTNLPMPADVDGSTPPPAGAPGLFYTFKDNSSHGGSDRLEIFEFDVDWVTPANSTFTLVDTLPVTSYTYTVCGFFNLNCIPQGGTTQRVDPVSEWPMWRLAYRNWGTHQTLVANFTIDVGSDRAGIRWYELRKTASNWTIHQEGTHAPAADKHYWMGSIAMDDSQNIALAYSYSSTTDNPSIRYTSRLASDPLGTMGSEAIMFSGGGSQTGNNRWGDYAALSLDPADGCTFWFTTEYYPSNSGNDWNTRIGKFKLPECGNTVPAAADVEVQLTDTPDPVIVGNNFSYTIEITNNGPDAAANVVAEQTLPSEVSYVSNDSGCTEASGTVTCNIVSLANGASSTIEVVVTADVTGTANSQITVSNDITDTVPANNSASTTTTIVDSSAPQADLMVTGQTVITEVVAGDTITYTLVVTNNGPDEATNVVLVDTLPGTVNYVSGSAGCTHLGGVVTCTLGSLANGVGQTVEIVVETTTTGTVINTVSVTSDQIDPTSGNNSTQETVQVTPVGGLYYLYLPIIATTPTPPSFAEQVITIVNAERAITGCNPLTINNMLVTAAQGHSQDMAQNDFFSHNGSNGSSPWDRMEAAGYSFSAAGENIAAGQETPEDVMTSWMNSSGHRANILNCNFEDIGVGYVYLENDTGETNYHHYWTQVFGKP